MDELLLAACREASAEMVACAATTARFADNVGLAGNIEFADALDLCVSFAREGRAIERVITIAARTPRAIAAKATVMADYRKDMDGSTPDWRTVDLALSLAEDAAALARSFATEAHLPSP